jgi:hypothetical protein
MKSKTYTSIVSNTFTFIHEILFLSRMYINGELIENLFMFIVISTQKETDKFM